jgi:hypothetical protein
MNPSGTCRRTSVRTLEPTRAEPAAAEVPVGWQIMPGTWSRAMKNRSSGRSECLRRSKRDRRVAAHRRYQGRMVSVSPVVCRTVQDHSKGVQASRSTSTTASMAGSAHGASSRLLAAEVIIGFQRDASRSIRAIMNPTATTFTGLRAAAVTRLGCRNLATGRYVTGDRRCRRP